MPTVREFFLAEAGAYLDQLEAVLRAAGDTGVQADELRRLCRGLRGSAQMAQAEPVRRVAQTLEAAARALAGRTLAWSAEVRSRLQETVADLRVIVAEGDDSPETESRVGAALERWRAFGLEDVAPAPTPPPAAAAAGALTPELRDYAISEVTTIVSELDGALPGLARDPRDREPLKSLLRRQRVLMGTSWIERLPVVAETLEAMEDLTRLIARRNVAVEGGWLDVYRFSRDVLMGVLQGLRRGDESIPPGHALSRLRTLRQELHDRYGPSDEPAQALLEQSPPLGAGHDGVVPIESLCYRGRAALERALELMPTLQGAVADDPAARAAAEEVADLIRSGSA